MRNSFYQWRAEPLYHGKRGHGVHRLFIQAGVPGIDRRNVHLSSDKIPPGTGHFRTSTLAVSFDDVVLIGKCENILEPSLAVGTPELWHRLSSVRPIVSLYAKYGHHSYDVSSVEDFLYGYNDMPSLSGHLDRAGREADERLASRISADVFLLGMTASGADTERGRPTFTELFGK